MRSEPVNAISVQRVADAAGVTSSSIYKAYASKYEPFAEASRRVLIDQVGEVAESVDESAPPADRLRQVLADLMAVCSEQPFAVAYLYGMFPLLHHAEVASTVREHVAAVDDDVRDRLRRRVGDAVEAGVLTGEVDELVELCRLAAFGYLGAAVHGEPTIAPRGLRRLRAPRARLLRAAAGSSEGRSSTSTVESSSPEGSCSTGTEGDPVVGAVAVARGGTTRPSAHPTA